MKKYRCYHELLWVKRGDYTCIACIHCYSVYKTVKPYDISDDNWIKQSRDNYETVKEKFGSIRYPDEREDMLLKTRTKWMSNTAYYRQRKKEAKQIMEQKKYSALIRNASI